MHLGGFEYQKLSLSRKHARTYPLGHTSNVAEASSPLPGPTLNGGGSRINYDDYPQGFDAPIDYDQTSPRQSVPPSSSPSPSHSGSEEAEDEGDIYGTRHFEEDFLGYFDEYCAPNSQAEPPIDQPQDPDMNFQPVGGPQIPEPGADQAQEDRLSLVPPAFREVPAVRMAYLMAVMANVYGHLMVTQATNQLNNTLDSLAVAGVLPNFPRPVCTLVSAKRRLGIDPDQWINQYCICSKCWKHYTPKELEDLDSPLCIALPDCTGVLYKDSQDSKKKRIQTPINIHPQTSIIGSLCRTMMRPGFAKSLRDNRAHQPGHNDDDDFIMTDMPDGDAWHEQETGTVRELGDHGTVHDSAPDGGPEPHNLNDRRDSPLRATP
jgi:hypothetical protein